MIMIMIMIMVIVMITIMIIVMMIFMMIGGECRTWHWGHEDQLDKVITHDIHDYDYDYRDDYDYDHCDDDIHDDWW